MIRIDVESLRDAIRSNYRIVVDYDEYEQELMRDLEFGYINENEFDNKLNAYYEELENEQNARDNY